MAEHRTMCVHWDLGDTSCQLQVKGILRTHDYVCAPGCANWNSPSASGTQSLAPIEQPQIGLVIYQHGARFGQDSQLTEYQPE